MRGASRRARVPCRCRPALRVVHLHTQGGVRGSGFVFLWHVKLTLLLETRACVALAQGLEGRPMLGELLCDTLLGRDD